MFLIDLLKSFRANPPLSRGPRGRRRTPAPPYRPRMEALDERCLPSAGVVPPAALALGPGHAVTAHTHRKVHHRHGFAAKFPDRSITPLVTEGAVATLSGTIVDPDRNGTFLLQVKWGDGSPVETFKFPPHGQAQAFHTYTAAGQFTVQVAWRDIHGPALTDDLTIDVAA
jgi:hypothetical protein